MATAITYDHNILTCEGLTASENSDSVGGYGAKAFGCCVQCVSGGGTGFNSGVVTIQCSMDDSKWHTLKDAQGGNVTFSADGYAEVSSGMNFFRASADGSVSDVDVSFIISKGV